MVSNLASALHLQYYGYIWSFTIAPWTVLAKKTSPPTGPGHLGDVGVLSPRVDQGGVTPAAFCQEDASRVDEDEPREDQAIHQWMSSSPKGGVCGHGSDLDLS